MSLAYEKNCLVWGSTCVKYIIYCKNICVHILKNSRLIISGTLKKRLLGTRVCPVVGRTCKNL